MSQTDPVQEFYTDLDDWWGQLWGNRIAAKAPDKKMKDRFFRYVYNRCRDVGTEHAEVFAGVWANLVLPRVQRDEQFFPVPSGAPEFRVC